MWKYAGLLFWFGVGYGHLLQGQDFQMSQWQNHLALYHPTSNVLFTEEKSLQVAYRWEQLPQTSLQNYFLSYQQTYKDFTLGLTFASSTAGPTSLENNRLALQGSYQRILNDNNDALTLGARFGFFQRRIRSGNFSFDRQYISGTGWDRSLTSGENLSAVNSIAPVLDAGLLFRKYFARTEWNIGGSVLYINRPDWQLLEGSNFRNPIQVSMFSRLSLRWNDRWRGDFYGAYNRWKTFTETLVGTMITYQYSDDVKIKWGGGSRVGDAFIMQAGVRLKDLEIMGSLELGHRQIKVSKNTVELNISYTLQRKKIVDHRHGR